MIGPQPTRGEALCLSRRLDCAPDPLRLFEQLRQRGPALLLESADAVERRPLRSLLMAGCAMRIEARGGKVNCRALSPNGENALAFLQERLAQYQLDAGDKQALFSFPAVEPDLDDMTRLRAPSVLDVLRTAQHGFRFSGNTSPIAPLCAGVFAYDLIDAFEPLPPAAKDPLGYPDYLFFLAEALINIDQRARTCELRGLVFGGDPNAVKRSYHDALESLKNQVQLCRQVATHHPADEPAATIANNSAALASQTRQVEAAECDMSDAEYAASVSALKQRIVAGDIFQVVPSRTFSLPCKNPLRAYRELRSLNPSPYMFYLDAGDHILFGASPETSVQVEVKGESLEMAIRPIAGTRRRGRHPDGSLNHDLDNRLEIELKLNQKEIAEHLMLVDLARNDAARVCKAGTRRAERLLSSDKYAHVIHLVSEIRGTLHAGLDALHAYQAGLNMGTLVGAPKLRAAQLLRQSEFTKRATYGGAIGYLASDGSMDTAIVIRSALVRSGIASVRAGAGVVHDSDPQAEADETRLKARSVLTAIARASLAAASDSEQGSTP